MKVSNTNLFVGLGVLVITGSNDTDHPKSADAEIVDWLEKIGADATFDFLDGPFVNRKTRNGHMLMIESNSFQIAQRVSKWICNRIGS